MAKFKGKNLVNFMILLEPQKSVYFAYFEIISHCDFIKLFKL